MTVFGKFIECIIWIAPNSAVSSLIDGYHCLFELEASKFFVESFKANERLLSDEEGLRSRHFINSVQFQRTMFGEYLQFDFITNVMGFPSNIDKESLNNWEISLFPPLIDLEIAK